MVTQDELYVPYRPEEPGYICVLEEYAFTGITRMNGLS